MIFVMFSRYIPGGGVRHGAGDVLADAWPLFPAAEGVRGDGGAGGGGGWHRAFQRLL